MEASMAETDMGFSFFPPPPAAAEDDEESLRPIDVDADADADAVVAAEEAAWVGDF
jgi:hypothetical protein